MSDFAPKTLTAYERRLVTTALRLAAAEARSAMVMASTPPGVIPPPATEAQRRALAELAATSDRLATELDDPRADVCVVIAAVVRA